jgi:nucleoside-diphosphate-sugar epimerase
VVIARPCHVYGPHFTEQDNRVYAQFIRNVLNAKNIVMKSSGVQFRSWCYVVDCVSALLHVLLNGKCGEVYNIADVESNISIRELAETIASIGGCKVVVELPESDERKGYNPVTKSIFSIEKLSALGWKARSNLRQGLESTISELKTRNMV